MSGFISKTISNQYLKLSIVSHSNQQTKSTFKYFIFCFIYFTILIKFSKSCILFMFLSTFSSNV